MARRRSEKARRRPNVSPTALYMASDGLYGPPEEIDEWEQWFYSYPSCSPKECLAVWCQVKEKIVGDWIAARPGTRPAWWWHFDAPEPRKRLGGVGKPASDCLAYVPHLTYGIPSTWMTRSLVEHMSGDYSDSLVDPSNPPSFESQTAYLKRLGLLAPGEAKRVHADAFEPEELNP